MYELRFIYQLSRSLKKEHNKKLDGSNLKLI